MNEFSVDDSKFEKFAGLAKGVGDSSLSTVLGMAVVVVGIAVFIAGVVMAGKWDGHLYDRKGCVQLQEIAGKVYKVDTCTGAVSEFKIE